MKIFLPLLCLVGFTTPVWAQTPAPEPKFEWKLRLKKGHKWTQKWEVVGAMYPYPGRFDTKFGVRQTLELHNEVLFANRKFYVLRAMFTRFEEATTLSGGGQTVRQPDRSKFTRAFVGVPFKIKQSVEGRILEVSGLDVLAKRGREMLFASTKAKEREELLPLLPDVKRLRDEVGLCQSFQVPAAPIAVGETASYFLEFYPSQLLEQHVTINRTLRFFDGKTARFDEERPRVPDQPKADGNFRAVAGAISGKTTVDVATGLPQIDLSIRLDGTSLTEDSNGKEYRAPEQEQTHIMLSTKLEP